MVPEHVAVPLERMAELGGPDAPAPAEDIVSAVPSAMVFVPVNATVAVAVDPLLKLTSQVCPAAPAIVAADEPDTKVVPTMLPLAPSAGPEKDPPATMLGLVCAPPGHAKLLLVTEDGAQNSYCVPLLT